MPPRKQPPEDQNVELRNTLENFTTNIHETLVQAVEVALTTVLQRQQNAPIQQPAVQEAQHHQEDSSDDELAENYFANPLHRRNQANITAPADHQLLRHEIQAEDRRWDSGFRVEIPEFSGNLST